MEYYNQDAHHHRQYNMNAYQGCSVINHPDKFIEEPV